MHVIAAFIIMLALINGFHPLKETPDGRQQFVTDREHHITVRTHVIPESVLQFRNLVKQSYDYSCGSAALATLLNAHLGENFEERQVIQGLLRYGNKEQIAERRAFSLLDMKRFVTVLGYSGNGYRAEMEDIRNADYWPCIVPIQLFGYRHFVVLRGVHGGHVFLADPWKGNTSYTTGQFEKMWYENVIFLAENQTGRRRNLLRLTEKDLRYIDEDSARRIFFDQWDPATIPPELEVDVPATGSHYK